MVTGGSAATFGGWNMAVSKDSSDRDATIDLFRFLFSVKARPVELGELPIIPNWKEVLQNALPRPSVPARLGDSQVSWRLWSALQNTFYG